jgi:hypothetical protein
MEKAWDLERKELQQLLKGNHDNEYMKFKHNESKLKEEISILKTTMEALQERLIEKEVLLKFMDK